jgi:hypothetical protein
MADDSAFQPRSGIIVSAMHIISLIKIKNQEQHGFDKKAARGPALGFGR